MMADVLAERGVEIDTRVGHGFARGDHGELRKAVQQVGFFFDQRNRRGDNRRLRPRSEIEAMPGGTSVMGRIRCGRLPDARQKCVASVARARRSRQCR